MNKQYKYDGQPLTPHIARELIRELFIGQTAQKQKILKAVVETHHERGGLTSEDLVTKALSDMEMSSLAKNLSNDSWSISPENTAGRRIETIDEFVRWADELYAKEESERYLFRGVPSTDYRIESSAYRRFKKGQGTDEEKQEKNKDHDFKSLIRMNENLIRNARLRGHDRRDGRKLEDLEILAEFQHYGAATFLMDFTSDALTALWFACKEDSGNISKDGKVVAVHTNPHQGNSGKPVFKIITLDRLKRKIDRLELNNETIYRWRPRHQNNRILAQQSVFLFGVLEIEIDPDKVCIIDRKVKEEIRESLQQINGITEYNLFPDFDGFASQYSRHVPYKQLTPKQYEERAYRALQRGEYEEAIVDYTVVIEQLGSGGSGAYYWRGIANNRLGLAANKILEPSDAAEKYCEDAINDFNEAVCLDAHNPYPYYNRGLANAELEKFDEAERDFKEALKLAQEAGNEALKPMIEESLRTIKCIAESSNE